MKLMTISEATRAFNVTSRMLRYYDEIGLLPSTRKEDYAYRVYDETAVKRLQQILTLRKLRIPLKKIALIFKDPEQMKIVEVFQESVNELNEEISALQTIRDILRMFITRISSAVNIDIKLDLIDDAQIMGVIQTLSLTKITLKEEYSMDDLKKAYKKLDNLRDRDVRIIYLPPAAVIASGYIHYEADNKTRKALEQFISENKLLQTKPDIRYYDFIRPNPENPDEYGYEIWITIPDNLDIPPEFIKKQFAGGLYAAYTIYAGEWDMWQQLIAWLKNSLKYEWNGINDGTFMHGLIDEHINYIHHINIPDEQIPDLQYDLLVPIKERAR